MLTISGNKQCAEEADGNGSETFWTDCDTVGEVIKNTSTGNFLYPIQNQINNLSQKWRLSAKSLKIIKSTDPDWPVDHIAHSVHGCNLLNAQKKWFTSRFARLILSLGDFNSQIDD